MQSLDSIVPKRGSVHNQSEQFPRLNGMSILFATIVSVGKRSISVSSLI
jgi:hypothetical protein